MSLWGSWLALAVATIGCRTMAPHDPNLFENDTMRIEACLDLRDHIVDLYAQAYVATQGVTLKPDEFVYFRDSWSEELAKRGTFERFEASCFDGLTKPMLVCGLAAKTPDEIPGCMQLALKGAQE